jgi:ribonuclease HI
VVINDENDFIIDSCKEYIGEATNNQAEYMALIKSINAIKKIIDKGEFPVTLINFYSDSELMVNQINFDYYVREPDLAVLNNKFHVKMKKIGIPYTISYIERSKNKAADRLANLAIDGQKTKKSR